METAKIQKHAAVSGTQSLTVKAQYMVLKTGTGVRTALVVTPDSSHTIVIGEFAKEPDACNYQFHICKFIMIGRLLIDLNLASTTDFTI
jgi:hypothetical protein